MSVMVVPDEGEVAIEKVVFDNLPTLNLRLFKNNLTPDQDTVLADFTECDFSGYAAVTLNGADFPDPSTVSNKASVTATAYELFQHNGGGTANANVYGYYVDDGTVCWGVEKFDAAQDMSASPDFIKVKVKLTMNSEN